MDSRIHFDTWLASLLLGLGYELVGVERTARGLFRVFIDHEQSSGRPITLDDCVKVSDYLSRVFVVEGIDYARLEISSPGIDRLIRTSAAANRFLGARVKLECFGPKTIETAHGVRVLPKKCLALLEAANLPDQLTCRLLLDDESSPHLGEVSDGVTFFWHELQQVRLAPVLPFGKKVTKKPRLKRSR